MSNQQPLDVFGHNAQPRKWLRVCAWHERGQGYFHSLFIMTGGMCEHCLEKLKVDLMKSHVSPDWFKSLVDGGWRQFAGGGYWPEYHRTVGQCAQSVYHVSKDVDGPQWEGKQFGITGHTERVVNGDDLSEVLEMMNESV